MSTEKPDIQKISADELRSDLDKVLARVSRNESVVVVEQDGRPLASIVHADELERLRRLEAEWEEPFGVVDRLRAAFNDLSDEEIERDVSEALALARLRRDLNARMPEVSQPTDPVGRTFWDPVSLSVLVREQGVAPVTNVGDLAGDFWPDDEGLDDFTAWLRTARRRG
jgi:prevent-host-death family protein